jgi:5'-3' exonuclease
MLRSLIEEHQPKAVCVCWDLGGAKAKQEVYPEYKEERKHKHELPDEFLKEIIIQMAELKKMFPYFGIKQLIKEGVEADDLIGLLCSGLEKVLVVSSDKGLFQVIGLGASLYYTPKNVIVNLNNFKEVVGVDSDLYPFYMTLVGHKGGGIPGLNKFGPVTSKMILEKHGGWDKWFIEGRVKAGVLEDLNKSQREIIQTTETKVALKRNYELAKLGFLVRGLKDEVLKEFEDQKATFNEEKIKEFFLENQFTSYLARFRAWIHPFRRLTLDSSRL